MADEQQQFSNEALNKFRQWHFWWLVVFSFLLIVIFVWYLPIRFLYQIDQSHVMMEEMSAIDENQPHGHDSSGTSIPLTSHSVETMDHESMMDDHMDMGAMMDHDSMNGDHAGHVPSMYHEETDIKEGLVVNFNANPVPYTVGASLQLNFFVNKKPDNLPVPESDLEIEHAKKMHVIGLRSDMNEFFHIHPVTETEDSAVFSVNHIFNKPGLYKIWSSIVKDGIGHTFGHLEIVINGDGPREEKKVTFARNVITGNYQVSLSINNTVVKNKELVLFFDIHTLNGQEIEVEQYLDADMHLAIIKDDFSQFIHTHPEDHDHAYNQSRLVNTALANGDDHDNSDGGDEVISFNVVFPEPGIYKAFAQFRPQGIDLPADEAITAEFWIQVEEKSALPISQWWLLLIVSAVLTTILSFIVKNYLAVKAKDVSVNVK